MNRFILPVLCAALLSGCITTKEQRGGIARMFAKSSGDDRAEVLANMIYGVPSPEGGIPRGWGVVWIVVDRDGREVDVSNFYRVPRLVPLSGTGAVKFAPIDIQPLTAMSATETEAVKKTINLFDQISPETKRK